MCESAHWADLVSRFARSNSSNLGGVMDTMDDNIKSLEASIDGLFNKAFEVADRYWMFVNRHEQQDIGPEARSMLELSCRKKGNHLDLRWQSIKWVGPKSKRSRIRTTIAKASDGLGYTDASLKVHAKEWECEIVKETEAELSIIRRQASYLVKAIVSVRNAKNSTNCGCEEQQATS